jgi:hypothetical protein
MVTDVSEELATSNFRVEKAKKKRMSCYMLLFDPSLLLFSEQAQFAYTIVPNVAPSQAILIEHAAAI